MAKVDRNHDLSPVGVPMVSWIWGAAEPDHKKYTKIEVHLRVTHTNVFLPVSTVALEEMIE